MAIFIKWTNIQTLEYVETVATGLDIGRFQLPDLIITELKSDMTC